MISDSATPVTGLLLSGGLDSAVLLGRLLEAGRRVQPFYVASGLVWEREELEAARELTRAFAGRGLQPLVVLRMPLDDVYEGHWSLTGHEPPLAGTPDKAVDLPGRNALLLVKVAVWCRMRGIERVALASLRNNPFADASGAFLRKFRRALAHTGLGGVRVVRPLARLSKRQVIELGRDYPLALTFSCLAPRRGHHCGRCNKCHERRTAFVEAGVEDRTYYLEGWAAT